MKRLLKNAASLKAGLLMALAMIFTLQIHAQVATTYNFSYSLGTYTNFTGGTQLGAGAIDDNNYTGVPIGFSFTYNGTAYTSCGVNTNGFIWFGGTTPAGATYTPISGASGPAGVVSAFGFDLIGRAANGNLRYQTTGAVGSRVFTVQWRAFRPYATLSDSYLGLLNYRFDVQIKLYETTNVIEFVYTYPGFLDNTNFAQVGLRGTSSADFKNRSVTCANTWATSTAGGLNTSTCRVDGFSCSVYPDAGATYRWTPGPPPAPPANDLCANAITLTHGTNCNLTSGTVLNATASLPPSSCSGFTSPTSNDVWYSFVAASPNPFIEVYPSSGMDAVFELFSGTCSAITSIGCLDASGTGGAELGVASGLVPGQTYYVRVYAYGTPTTSTFNICIYGGTLCTAPSFSACPGNQSATTAAGTCSAAVSYTATAAGTSPTLSYTFSGATTGSGSGIGSGSTFNVGTTTVTITATNACGSANCTFTVTVTDNQNPTISCPAAVSVNNTPGACSATVASLGTPTTSDNCGVASVTNNHPSTTYPVGTTTVTWTVTDVNGLTATCDQTVTVTDNENPTITCPATVSVNNTPGACSATVASLGTPTTSDNCGVASVTNNHPSTTYPVGNTTVTWTVTDVNGRTATCDQTVTVTDNENPTITCPATVSVNNTPGACSATVASLGTPTTSDNCGVASVTNNHPSTTYPVGNTTVTWTVTDVNGRTATCNQTVTVTDNENPTITCPGTQSIILSSNCQATLPNYTGLATTSDNCGVASVTQSPAIGTPLSGPGFVNVTLTVTDVNGRTANCTFVANKVDNTAPVVTCPGTQTVTLGANCSVALPDYRGLATVVENCGTPTRTQSPAPGTIVSGTGSMTVTITATDGSGNVSAPCTFTVNKVDNTAPTAVCQSITVNLDASGNASITASQVNNGSSDACGPVTLSATPTSFTCSNVSSPASSLFISEYIEGNSNNKAIEIYNGTGAAVNIGGYFVRTYFNGNAAVGNTITIPAGTILANGDVYVVAHGAANASILSVADFVTAAGLGWYNGDDAVTLETPGGVKIDIIGQIGCDPGTGWSLGGNGTENRTIRRNANVLQGVSVNPAGACGVASFATLGSEWTGFTVDNSAGLGAHSTTNGPTSVTLTVTDGSGNNSSCTAFVTVRDVTPPAAVCQNVSVNLDGSGNATVTAAQVNNGSSDACGIASLSLSQTAFTCANVGANPVTLTVTDVNGNSSTCSATVNVSDVTPPNAICQNVTVNLDATGNAMVTAAQVNNGSTDNCGIASMSVSPNMFTCADVSFPGGPTNLIISEYVEGSGFNKYIEVYNPTSNPINLADYSLRLFSNGASVPSSVTSLAAAGTLAPGATAVFRNPTATLYTGTSFAIGAVNFNGDDAIELFQVSTSSSVDIFGRKGEDPDGALNPGPGWVNGASQTTDRTLRRKPSVGGGVNLNPASGFPTQVSQWDVFAQNTVAGLGSHSYSGGGNVVTLTVTDVNGNTSTCNATVSVFDVTPPVAVCQNVTVNLNAAGTATVSAAQVNNGSSDACGIGNLSVSPSTFSCAEVGANTVTLTVTDMTGNSSTCTATVTVVDAVAPNALCQDLTVNLDASGNATVSAAQIDNGSNDACGVAGMSVTPGAFSCADVAGDTRTDLIISEYVEGTGNNKCVELYNGTGSAINLAAGNYVLRIYFNGSNLVGTSVALTGTIPAGGTYVVCNSAADPGFLALANQTSSASFYNGNDAVVLAKNGGTTVLDIFGRIGEDPGAGGWTGGASATTDRTLARNSNVTAGVTSNPNAGFPNLANQWTNFAVNTSSGLGSHTATAANAITLTVTDVNGNNNSCTAAVVVNDVTPPTAVCQNVTVQLDATGNGSTTAAAVNNGSSDACGIASLSLSNTAFTCANVGPNTVTLTVTDVNGNSSTCSAVVTVQDSIAPTAICQNLTLNLPSSGSTTITAAQIDNGSNDACGIASLSVNPNTFDCTDQGANTVTLTVTDVNGNVSTCTAIVTVNTAPVAVALSSPTYNCGYNISCNGNSDGSISSAVTGGCLPYSYSWSNGATTDNVSGLAAGTYTVTVTDVNGNTGTATITLTQPAALTAVILDAHSPPFACGYNISCNGASDGAVLAIPSGGCGPYTYQWSTGSTIQIVAGLPAGPVSVTITDANGCTTVANYLLTQPDPVLGTAVISSYTCGYNVSCYGASNGSVNQTVTGGCAPYNFIWSNGATTEDVSGLSAGTYGVTITDANGCTVTQSYTLTQPAPVTVTCPANVTVYSGYTQPFGCTTLTPSGVGGGCGPYSYAWSNGATTASITVCPTATTTYTLTVTDANGCTATCATTVCVINVSYGNNQVTICHIPPGNPGNSNTINVGANAVATHLAHGDYLGPCGSNGPCVLPTPKSDEPSGAGAGNEDAMARFEAFPNPFEVSTTLQFSIPTDEQVTVRVFNLNGVQVAVLFEGQVEANAVNSVEFKPEQVSSGVYTARLETTSGIVIARRLVLVK